MKNVTGRILIAVGILLIAGVIAVVSIGFKNVFPGERNNHCFDGNCGREKSGDLSETDVAKIVQANPTLNLSDLAEQQKTVMLDSTRHKYSNAERWDAIRDATRDLICTSANYQTRIRAILEDEALEAYDSERKAFSEWQKYQRTISADVIVEIWELYVGGTAGGSLEIMHPYNVANSDAKEQEILYNALMNTPVAAPFQGSATVEQITEAKDNLISSLSSAYSMFEGKNDWPNISHTAKEEDGFLTEDLKLFKEWIVARERLEPYLQDNVRTIYTSQKGYWLDLLLRNYKGEYGVR